MCLYNYAVTGQFAVQFTLYPLFPSHGYLPEGDLELFQNVGNKIKGSCDASVGIAVINKQATLSLTFKIQECRIAVKCVFALFCRNPISGGLRTNDWQKTTHWKEAKLYSSTPICLLKQVHYVFNLFFVEDINYNSRI